MLSKCSLCLIVLCLPFILASAPSWPPYFSTEWVIFNVPHDNPAPPFGATPLPPYSAGRGRTYYDWSTKSMLEVYDDFCVPIFQNGSNWACHFLNVGGISYLVTADPTSGYAPCCAFGKPWEPPAPNFLSADGIVTNGTTMVGPTPVDWWLMMMGEMQFGYGFTRDTTQDPAGDSFRIPGAFYFNGFVGWTQQNFFEFKAEKPDPSVFALPKQCINAPSCGYL